MRKKALAEAGAKGAKVKIPELQAALERIARLEGENARLEAENQQLLGQFVRWAYYAHTRGLDHACIADRLALQWTTRATMLSARPTSI